MLRQFWLFQLSFFFSNDQTLAKAGAQLELVNVVISPAQDLVYTFSFPQFQSLLLGVCASWLLVLELTALSILDFDAIDHIGVVDCYLFDLRYRLRIP